MTPDESRPLSVLPWVGDTGMLAEMTNTAIPVLVGQLVTDRTEAVQWALWPAEVYCSGCLLRIRLVPDELKPEYQDTNSKALFGTIQLLDGHDRELITVESGCGRIQLSSGRLPTRGGDPRTSEPWEYVWTLEYWWPRERWDDKLTLTWPAYELRLDLPVDIGDLRAARDVG